MANVILKEILIQKKHNYNNNNWGMIISISQYNTYKNLLTLDSTRHNNLLSVLLANHIKERIRIKLNILETPGSIFPIKSTSV